MRHQDQETELLNKTVSPRRVKGAVAILQAVVCFLLGNSPASEFYMPTFRNTLSVPSS